MKIKLCGMMRLEDIDVINEVKPDYAGVILSQPFRRRVDRETARSFRKALNPTIPLVGVFVNEDPKTVISFLEDGIIDLAQLHGDETEEDICYIKAVTAKQVIKAVKVRRREDVLAWLDSAADYLLFDAGTGSGQTFPWEFLADVNRDYFLAGGLNAGNLAEAAANTNAYCLDLSSGVETDGQKDPAKIREVIKIVRNM